MSQSIGQNFEYIGAHIKDYIKDNTPFNTFEIEDIKRIMKYSSFSCEDFNTLLEESHSHVSSNRLYRCTRNANISIKNIDEAISTLKTVQKYMKLGLLRSIIDIFYQIQNDQSESTNKISKHQTKLNQIQNEKENLSKEVESLQSEIKILKVNDLPNEFISKISKLKNSEEFYEIYNFFVEISENGSQQMMSKAFEEGLWQKQNENYPYGNVLHEASYQGNLQLVKSLIESGCDKEITNNYQCTALHWASLNGKLEVVQYLISVGANKEAKNNYGWTPLIASSLSGKLEVVQYLISVGANKDAKNSDGETPLILASSKGHLEVVQYLISVGANKEAKNNDGQTALSVSKDKVREYLLSVE
ncbi:hypothetical protein TVAG_250240 [Trichomonas vaginalis G3]|uniref:Uncharacterized protein n=1 Tax=Trichomonas vaginalis (strain ATCC PRA-98 / G3) TaxID=412133 RepID=A2DCM7_TRIV3|nr:spectrin binding [Trichomonas vaginalis G3]EAY21964.1 hypothetical protein TVAG_250240 [Trichomonas vaginalis G3]KAI5487557.1 spectrin binding [Trichomonas vaginalis G3]|eukprot:XP_001582950.1 hypothetical protein [Trichomonas vaginalis G3]